MLWLSFFRKVSILRPVVFVSFWMAGNIFMLSKAHGLKLSATLYARMNNYHFTGQYMHFNVKKTLQALTLPKMCHFEGLVTGSLQEVKTITGIKLPNACINVKRTHYLPLELKNSINVLCDLDNEVKVPGNLTEWRSSQRPLK